MTTNIPVSRTFFLLCHSRATDHPFGAISKDNVKMIYLLYEQATKDMRFCWDCGSEARLMPNKTNRYLCTNKTTKCGGGKQFACFECKGLSFSFSEDIYGCGGNHYQKSKDNHQDYREYDQNCYPHACSRNESGELDSSEEDEEDENEESELDEEDENESELDEDEEEDQGLIQATKVTSNDHTTPSEMPLPFSSLALKRAAKKVLESTSKVAIPPQKTIVKKKNKEFII
jgi:hypothetical protein